MEEVSATDDPEVVELKKTKRRLAMEIKLYEEGMTQTRKQDAERHAELEAWEQRLKARERALYLKDLEFEKRKKRWEQLKEITS